jgi:putative membrane protein
MTHKTNFEQQILFDEQDITLQSNNDSQEQQLFVANDDWQPIELEQDIALSASEEKKETSWLARILLVAFSAVIGIELYDFFVVGLIESPIVTSLYGLIFLCVAILSGSSLIREISGLRQLKARDKLRHQIENVEDATHEEVETLCENITANLPCDLSNEQIDKWREAKVNELSNEELMQLYSRIVLTQVDHKALAEVAKYSSESVVLVALSPVALLDMMIMLWRNLTMVDKIAGLYGLKLGYWSRIKLVKQVFTNMLYAGASEVVADVSMDMLGADLLGRLSGRLAQGLGAGMLTARLGLRTVYLCRPMPFDENAPKLSQVRKEVIQQIKQLVPHAKNNP